MASSSPSEKGRATGAAEAFRRLVASGDMPDGLRPVLSASEVKKVRISLADRAWEVELDVPRPLSSEETTAAERFLIGKVPGLRRVSLICRTTPRTPPADPREALAAQWEAILDALQESVPSVRALVPGDSWRLDGNRLEVTVAGAAGTEFLNRRGVARELERLVLARTGATVTTALIAGPEPELAEGSGDLAPEVYVASYIERPEAARDRVLLGRRVEKTPRPVKDVVTEEREVVLAGEVARAQVHELNTGRKLITFDLTDYTDSITVKAFAGKANGKNGNGKGGSPTAGGDVDWAGSLGDGAWVLVRGQAQVDRVSQELTVMAEDIVRGRRPERVDPAEEKRIELHLHTKMSAMDSVVDVSEAVRRASSWGHPALAITDHGVVQAFPEAFAAGKKYGVKVILGVEAYLVDDLTPPCRRPRATPLDQEDLVVVDVETTGLWPLVDGILEIGAVRISGDDPREFQTFVRPSRPIPPKVGEMTGISDEMVAKAPSPEEAIAAFLDFAGGACLIAHNAGFDLGFLREAARRAGRAEWSPTVIDTLAMARALLPGRTHHKLDKLAEEFGVALDRHHRAVDDARATGQVFRHLLARLPEGTERSTAGLNGLAGRVPTLLLPDHHAVILVRDQAGLKRLYKLISHAHTRELRRNPRIPKSLLAANREGLIIGSACEAGEVFQAFLRGEGPDEVAERAGFYDYLEIQPIGNNAFLLGQGAVASEAALTAINRAIYDLGQALRRPVVATGDVHFLDPHQAVYRAILMNSNGYEDADRQGPFYYHTTEEMLAAVGDLGDDVAREVVLTNPAKVAAMVEDVQPVPTGVFPPDIEGAAEIVQETAMGRAKALYGDPLPGIVAQRLERELHSIITNGYAGIYLLAARLVEKSMGDGYLVGSRGSVGSSLVATMCGITEVNPMPAHYLCPNQDCRYSEFVSSAAGQSGFDLPARDCPLCGTPLKKDGHDIPFETFLGFEGDKVPDIDLNFSGEYQPRIHEYAEELLGDSAIYRAGTIATVAERTAFGYVRGYMNDRALALRRAEVTRLATGCSGVRRTTGRHPGGLVIVPKGREIEDFCPIQFPANDPKAGQTTTHFDYHSIECLVKLDLLGHDDPTALRMLQDLTGVDVRGIPFDDPETLSIFSSLKAVGLGEKQIEGDVGTIGVPEFGTRFVRQMLQDTRPTTFTELVRISGLSHGTDVWLNNAQDLIKEGTAGLREVICCRDDIMVYLIFKGLQPSLAFKIMEDVRKGRGLKPNQIEAMQEKGVPAWYIQSCLTIRYMFPKAHAAAYVMMSFRVAFFKVHHPAAFYAVYFTVRGDDFNSSMIVREPGELQRQMKAIMDKGNEATAKEKSTLTDLEVAHEMYLRGQRFLPVDLERSEAARFQVTPDGLLAPFVALTGFGAAAAAGVIQARAEAPFTSIEDLTTRARLSRAHVDILREHGCLRGLSETNQLSLF
ncbi:MAG: PolC-type DNA polymerase III [Bacillota bacterium]